jgi:hypothetical protein
VLALLAGFRFVHFDARSSLLFQTVYSGVKRLPVDNCVAFQYCGTTRVSFTDAADAVFLLFVA